MKTRIGAAAGITAGATLAMGGVAHAACTCTVDSLSDPTEGGRTTLRDAITSANANPGSTITFASGLTGSVDLASDLPAISRAVDIEGPGAGELTVDGNGHRIFFLDSLTSADPIRIAGLTLTGGQAADRGGAIDDYVGTLTVANDVITGNHALNGGGIDSDQTLTVTGSTISGNSATYQGGGIDHYTVGALTVENSTVSGNTAKDIGGILDEDVSTGPLTISHSAISGNTGVSFGGGLAVYRVGGASRIEDTTVAGNHSTGEGGNSYAGLAAGVNLDLYAGSSLTISGTTIAGNDAAVAGGGAHVYTASVNNIPPVLDDTIVAGNSAPVAPDLLGDAKAAFSLVRNTAGASISETVPGSNLTGVDPQLGTLASNGGPTQTMKPAAGSPVVDRGSAFGLMTDQRGAARPFDVPTVANSGAPGADGSDIGAVELQAGDIPAPVPTSTSTAHKKKCKKKKKKHKRSAESAKKKCKKKKKRK